MTRSVIASGTRTLSRLYPSSDDHAAGTSTDGDAWQLSPGAVAVAVVCVMAALVHLSGGLIFALVSFAWLWRQRRRTTLAPHVNPDDLAYAVELFAVALHNGLNAMQATAYVAEWVDDELGDGLRRTIEQVDRGRPFSDALEELPLQLGGVHPLVSALVAHDRYGSPIADNLARLAADSRADARRRAEQAARRLPVTLLFPLTVCVLPAFLLLTVVPAAIDALSGFSLFASPDAASPLTGP